VLQCVPMCCKRENVRHTLTTHTCPLYRQGVLQCVSVCCSVLQCVEVCCSALQCVAVCCSVLQERDARHTLTTRLAPFIDRVCCSALQCVAVCCNVLHCKVCCSALQCVAMWSSATHRNTLQHTATHPDTTYVRACHLWGGYDS